MHEWLFVSPEFWSAALDHYLCVPHTLWVYVWACLYVHLCLCVWVGPSVRILRLVQLLPESSSLREVTWPATAQRSSGRLQSSVALLWTLSWRPELIVGLRTVRRHCQQLIQWSVKAWMGVTVTMVTGRSALAWMGVAVVKVFTDCRVWQI